MTATTPSAGGGSYVALATGPLDEFDTTTNGDPDSTNGEDDESGFDEMSPELGWEDEADEDDEEEGDEEE